MLFEVLVDPLLPWPFIAALAAASLALVLYKVWRRQPGIVTRALMLALLLGAVLNPSLSREVREYFDDIILVLEDRSASQEIGSRTADTSKAASAIKAGVERFDGIELREFVFENRPPPATEGTELMAELDQALSGLPLDRVAAAVLITDGQISSREPPGDFEFPVHALITGHRGEFDRRLSISRAPAFAVVGQDQPVTALLEDTGDFPELTQRPMIEVSVNGGPTASYRVGEELELPIGPIRRGRNLAVFSTPPVEGETTARNNVASVIINGVRERLRVLLVSGFPHAGQRTWRNLLKSDDSLELIHFTILRHADSQDMAGNDELALIPFPVNELFLEKIDTFDLIILDRYVLQGFLPSVYFHYMNRYVAEGGALLVSAGPEFAESESISSTALESILPGQPTGTVFETGFRPGLTETGYRHPVTSGLPGVEADASGDPVEPEWGRWFRQVDIEQASGHALMSGVKDGGPLLLLDRVGEGRIALLASDQAWLWHRGVEGGGPQIELLRRLIHWLMKEPELEEEALRVEVKDERLVVERRTVEDREPDFRAIGPDGNEISLEAFERSPGRIIAQSEAVEPGLYRVADGDKVTTAAAEVAYPVEYASTAATGELVRAVVENSGGGVFWIEDGVPEVRRVENGRIASGRDWLGLVQRDAYRAAAPEIVPLMPALLAMLAVVLATAAAWHRESGSSRS